VFPSCLKAINSTLMCIKFTESSTLSTKFTSNPMRLFCSDGSVEITHISNISMLKDPKYCVFSNVCGSICRTMRFMLVCRACLCEVVRVKMESYAILKLKGQSAEDYCKEFLEAEVRTLWPKGWMQSRFVGWSRYTSRSQGGFESPVY